MFLDEKAGFVLAYFYGSLSMEMKTEKLVYDFGNALVAVGGSMGLFLGFSCLSIAWTVLEFVYKKCNIKESIFESALPK